jgi:hypothetical protein
MKTLTLAFILAALVTSGCSAHRTRIDCEGQLVAINAPAPTSTKASAHEE